MCRELQDMFCLRWGERKMGTALSCKKAVSKWWCSSISKTHVCSMTLLIMHTQIRKALELHEQLKQRMGVVIVGPSGSGKSTVWRLLKAAMTKRGEVVKDYTMNPKAMPRTHVRNTDTCILHSPVHVLKPPQLCNSGSHTA